MKRPYQTQITKFYKQKEIKRAQIFVGRIDRYDSTKLAKKQGFVIIKIHVNNTGFGKLSPYNLKTKDGYIMENVWQFSKLYKKVRKVRLTKSRWDPNDVIWEHNAENHVDEKGNPNDNYWKWRLKGFINPYPVRYPNSYHGRNEVVCSILNLALKRLDYVSARKEIYCKVFWKCVRGHPMFLKLKAMYDSGESLLILDVDGPDYHPSSPYNTVQRGQLGDDNVGCIEINEENVKAMLKNTNKPFGHGYVIGTLIKNKSWIV